MKCDVRHIHGKKFKRESRLSVRIHLWTNQVGKKAREPAGLFFLCTLYQECSITGASPHAYCVFHLHQHIFKLFSLLTRDADVTYKERVEGSFRRASQRQTKVPRAHTAADAAARIVLYTCVCEKI
jgi:hypothetical protein